jgi:hypothetical protein
MPCPRLYGVHGFGFQALFGRLTVQPGVVVFHVGGNDLAGDKSATGGRASLVATRGMGLSLQDVL